MIFQLVFWQSSESKQDKTTGYPEILGCPKTTSTRSNIYKNASAELTKKMKKKSVKTMSSIVIINVTQSAMIIIHF